MFGKNAFDEAIKSAKKVDEILSNSDGIRKLNFGAMKLNDVMNNISDRLKMTNGNADDLAKIFMTVNDNSEALLDRINKIHNLTIDQAAAQAGMSRKQYEQIKFYDDQVTRLNYIIDALTEERQVQEDLYNQASVSGQKHIQQILDAVDATLAETEAQKMLLKVMKEAEAAASKKTLWQNIDEAFGGLLTKISKIVELLSNPFIAAITALAFLIKSIVGSYRDGLKTTIEIGLDASQRFHQIGKAQAVVADAIREKSLLGLSEVIKSADALASRLGTVEIPNKLIQASAQLSRDLGTSVDDAANILEYFTRLGKQTPEAAKFSTEVIKATALQNKFNAGLAISDFAANTANFAKSAKTGAAEMTKSVIQARQLGVAFSTIVGIADNIVSNFEGALEAQATIGAFAPGFDMTGLLIASQFGTDEDIGRELQSAVQSMGMEFDQLPRSFKLAISSSLGVSVQELGNLMKGEEINVMSPGEQAMVDAQSHALNELQQAIVNPLDSINRAVFGIWAIMMFSKKKASAEAAGMTNYELNNAAAAGGELGKSAITELNARAALENLNKLKDAALKPNLSTESKRHYSKLIDQASMTYELAMSERSAKLDMSGNELLQATKQQRDETKALLEYLKGRGDKPIVTHVDMNGRTIVTAIRKVAGRDKD